MFVVVVVVAVVVVVVGAVGLFALDRGSDRSGRPLAIPAPTADVAPTAPPGPTIAAVMHGHHSGFVLADRAGTITYRNEVANAMSGTHAGVLLDAAIERHVDPATAGQSTEEIEIYGPPKTVLSIESRHLLGGGTAVFVDDVSERRRIEQVRTDFVANISHELKTPIGALSVLAETLQDEVEPETIARVVHRMMSEADRASRTIDDLMELSRIEMGGERTIEPVAVVDIIDGALDRVTELVAQTRVDISVLMPSDRDGPRAAGWIVEGDRRQLVSALGNLVENAVKYSDPGGAVQIRAHVDASSVEMMVADQGPGIPQRDLNRVFERFYRVDRARSRSTGGTGLGLSIVRHVATSHHGEVMVSSQEGQGTTFTLRLPLAAPSTDATAAMPLLPERANEPDPVADVSTRSGGTHE